MTKDSFYMKEHLGYRSINLILIYIYLVSFEGDKDTIRVVKNLEESVKFLEAGFKYMIDYCDGKVFWKMK